MAEDAVYIHYGANGCRGCPQSKLDSKCNVWSDLRLSDAVVIHFTAFRLNFGQSTLCHTGIRIDIVRKSGEMHSFVHEVAGGRHANVKSMVFLRSIEEGADELVCRDQLRLVSVSYRHGDHHDRINALFTSDWDYCLVRRNCRHHVLSFVERLEEKFDYDRDVHDWLKGIKKKDIAKGVVGTALVVAGLAGIAWAWGSYYSSPAPALESAEDCGEESPESEEDDEEDPASTRRPRYAY